MTITIYHWIALSTLLFSIGAYGVFTRTNAIMALMSLELMLNAAAMNFISFNYYLAPGTVSGQVFATFVIAIAAAEAAVGLAIVIRLFRSRGHVDLSRANRMKN